MRVLAIALLTFFGPVIVPAEPASSPQIRLEKAQLQLERGQYAAAERLVHELLPAVEAAHGVDSIEVADVLDLLVEARRRGGKAAEPGTRALAERAVRIVEASLGPEHLRLAASLNLLASVLTTAELQQLALPVQRRSLAILEASDDAPPTLIADGLITLGLTGRQLAATEGEARRRTRELFERALGILEGAATPARRRIARLLVLLGRHHIAEADFFAAKRSLQRAWNVSRSVFPEDHPDLADAPFNLALALSFIGEYAEARALLEETMRIQEATLGPEHPKLGYSIRILGNVFMSTGDLAGARRAYQRSLAIKEAAFGPDHYRVSAAAYSLGEVYVREGRYADARALMERAVRIREQHGTPSSAALVLHGLADLLTTMGEHAEARRRLLQAIEVWDGEFALDDHNRAQMLLDLARLETIAGRTTEALRLTERAVGILEANVGVFHPRVAAALNRLARVRLRAGQFAAGIDAAVRSEEIGREHVRQTVRGLSEKDALTYASARAVSLDLIVAVARSPRRERKTAKLAAWEMLVRSRAIVLDEMAARHRIARRAADPRLATLNRALVTARQELADLVVRGPSGQPHDRHASAVRAAHERRERAERALARASVRFRDELRDRRVGSTEVAKALPAQSALVSFVRHADASEIVDGTDSYLAFVLRSGEVTPELVTLGDAIEIESLVMRWRQQTASLASGGVDPAEAERANRRTGRRLGALLWEPLARHVVDARTVFVVPDGALHTFPLAALPVGTSDYLIDDGPSLHYLAAERDLVREEPGSVATETLLALGGPAFDDAGPVSGTDGSFRGLRSSCGDFRSLRFQPLPAAAVEARAVVALWRERASTIGRAADVNLLIGSTASEGRLKRLAPQASVLHLATHGFFLDGRCASLLDGARGFRLESPDSEPPASASAESPLLLAGLALAGANQREAAGVGDEDGILTAEEIAALDLGGVRWAVLSACDTGAGEVRAGEGVLGMRRAFRVAGVDTVIMSLWAVKDEAAREWMTALYEARLTHSRSTVESVRDASLDVLRRRRAHGASSHPFYWAGFVAAGDWH